MIRVRPDISDSEVAALFKKLAGYPKAVKRGALLEIGEAVKSISLESFEHEKNPDGKKWQPSQRAMEEGGQTLTDSAMLKNSIDVALAANAVEVGSNIVYAAIHNLGGEAGRKSRRVFLPQRQFLPDADSNLVKSEALEILADTLNEVIQ